MVHAFCKVPPEALGTTTKGPARDAFWNAVVGIVRQDQRRSPQNKAMAYTVMPVPVAILKLPSCGWHHYDHEEGDWFWHVSGESFAAASATTLGWQGYESDDGAVWWAHAASGRWFLQADADRNSLEQ